MSPGSSRPRFVGRRVSRTLVSSAGAAAPVGTTFVAGFRTRGLRSTRCVEYAGRMREKGERKGGRRSGRNTPFT